MTTKAIVASPPSPEPSRLPVLALAAAWTMIAVSLLVYWRGWSHHVPIGYGADLPALLSTDLFAASASGIGCLIARQRVRSLVGWLLLLLGLATAAIILAVYSDAVAAGWSERPALGLGGWLAGAGLQPVIGGLTGLLMFVYPDGHLPSRSWRPAVVLLVAGVATRFAETGLTEPSVPYLPTLDNPFDLLSPATGPRVADIAGAAPHLGLLTLLVGMGLAALSLVARYRAAGPDVRSQIRWFMVAGTLVTITLVPLAQLFVFVSPREGRGQDLWVTFFICASLFPAAIWLAVTRHHLYDIDRLVNRAFVHGTMIALLAGTFTAAIGLSQRLFVHVTGDTSDVAIVLTTLVAAAAYTTVRRRLERLADRLFRYDIPRLGAFSQSVNEMVTLLDPEATARRMLGEAIGVLHASGGWVELDDDTLDVAALPADGSTDRSAARCAPELSVEIPGRTGPIGRLVVGPRLGGAPYRPRDREILEEVAGLLGRALELRPARPSRPSTDRRRHRRLALGDRPATQALGEPLAV